jgi:uncharacterized protein (TIGR02145 family)
LKNRSLIGLVVHFRAILVIILFTTVSFSGFSQGEFNNWYFGFHTGVTFNSGSPVALTNCAFYFSDRHVPSTVSDSSGSLLFYAGIFNFGSGYEGTLYDKSHQPTTNGTNLVTTWESKQNYLSVQKLDDDSSYYLFVMDERYSISHTNPQGLTYNIIDLRLNGGLGDIITGQKNRQVPGAQQTATALSGTRHKNNRDIWVTVREYYNSNNFLSYLVTSAGISTIPVVSNSLFFLTYPYIGNGISMIRFSPDGTRMVALYDNLLEFCQFNSSTGHITPLFTIQYIGNFSPCAEFSVNNHFLYVNSLWGGGSIYQYDATLVDSAQFEQSKVLVTSNASSEAWLQRGPDNRIYVADWETDTLGVINYPAIQGTGCNYQRSMVPLAGNICLMGFPQFVQRYYLYMSHSGQCVGDSISFSHLIWPPADSLYWNFGDPGSGGENISHLTHPKHKFTASGSYVITLIARHEDQRFDTAIQTIVIKDSPHPSVGPDRTICLGDSVTLDAGFCTGCTYQWDNIATGQINIGNGQTLTVYDSGLYVVHVTNTSGCTGRDTVQVSVSPPPLLTTSPLAKSICSGDSTFIPLSSNVPAATFIWSASLTSGNVSGFSADSGLIINQILTNNISSPGIVTYHITPKVGSCIGDTTDYAVTVNPRDTANVSITASATVICAGRSVTFTATPTAPGNLTFQWFVNNIPVGSNTPIFTYVPINDDSVHCSLLTDHSCVTNNPDTSNVLTMTVNPNLPVSVSVMASENPFCLGTSVTFTATPTAPGNLTYQWYVNGIPVGSNSPILTYLPINNDAVHCSLLTDHLCVLNNPALSDTITMIGFPGLPADVTITASPNPSCQGVPVTFTATPINGGSNPSYQWQVNGINVGTNSPVYTYIPASLDLVSCIMTSNLVCVTNNPASSIQYPVSLSPTPAVTFTPCFDTMTTTNAKPIKLKGGIPIGGTYTGPGVSAGYFYPNLAGVGTHVVTYTYTNAALCSASSISRIHEFTNPIFNCGNVLLDIRDGKSYPTIQIGSQCWFAADLDYGIQIVESIRQRDNCISENYRTAVGGRQSAVYQWDEIMQYSQTPGLQGLCPPAWHVPTEPEWNTLFANWTNNAFAAAPLKYSGYSGFNAFLSGARHETVQWDYQNFAAFFWSSTSHGPYKAWAHGMNDPDYSVSYYPSLRSNAFSVRCLKD